jgi:hypothetical protein
VGRVGGLFRRQSASSLCSRNSVSHSLHLLITSLLLVCLVAEAYMRPFAAPQRPKMLHLLAILDAKCPTHSRLTKIASFPNASLTRPPAPRPPLALPLHTYHATFTTYLSPKIQPLSSPAALFTHSQARCPGALVKPRHHHRSWPRSSPTAHHYF